MMEIRKLDAQAVLKLFHEKMAKDFPPDELRPYFSIKKLMESGEYFCFGCYENDGLCAYAHFVANGRALLLDYFAVNQNMRGTGVGSRFLNALRGLSELSAPRVLIEVESAERTEIPEEKEIRLRRIRFYEHCGCSMTDIESVVFGVHYSIMQLPLSDETENTTDMRKDLESIYRIVVPPLVSDEAEYQSKCRIL